MDVKDVVNELMWMRKVLSMRYCGFERCSQLNVDVKDVVNELMWM